MPTPSRDLAVPVPAPPSNFQPLHLRFVVLWVGGEDPSLRVPSQQLVDSYVTHVVHGDCMGLVRSLMGNLRPAPLFTRSTRVPSLPPPPLSPRGLFRTALSTWEGGGHRAGTGGCPAHILELVPSSP